MKVLLINGKNQEIIKETIWNILPDLSVVNVKIDNKYFIADRMTMVIHDEESILEIIGSIADDSEYLEKDIPW